MVDDKAFNAFMLAVHEHGTSGLGYRKALEAYESARQHPAAPTEAMCDQARGFIMGLDLGCRKWGDMQRHLDAGGYPTLPRILEMAKNDPKGHITKWDVAECIYKLMTQPAAATPGATTPTGI